MTRIIKNAFGLHTEQGWAGNFTRNQASGCIPNGTRIVKTLVESGDTHKLGDTGVVLGSIAAAGMSGYFIEWDDRPKHAVFTCSHKIGELENA